MILVKDLFVTCFDSKLEGSDKLTYKNLSVVQSKNEDGTYKTENWNGRFVGKAKAFVDELKNGALISITGEVHNEYYEGKNYTYILVKDAKPYQSKEEELPF